MLQFIDIFRLISDEKAGQERALAGALEQIVHRMQLIIRCSEIRIFKLILAKDSLQNFSDSKVFLKFPHKSSESTSLQSLQKIPDLKKIS